MSARLWHVREAPLEPGAIIAPGRWGTTVLRNPSHQFFARELALEAVRAQYAPEAVSRLACAFAWESEAQAVAYARPDECVLEVEPARPDAPRSRLDMLWITWMGEPDAPPDRVARQRVHYWRGESTRDHAAHAIPAWEVLVGAPLRVLRRVR